MPIAVGHEVTSTALQQSVFGLPPSSLPAPTAAQAATTQGAEMENKEAANVDSEGTEPKGMKRAREEESDDEGAPIEEDSDAPMEASSDEED